MILTYLFFPFHDSSKANYWVWESVLSSYSVGLERAKADIEFGAFQVY